MGISDNIKNSTVNFKRVDQVGIVVRDIEDAIRNMSDKLGVKKWYRPSKSEDGENTITLRGKEIHPEVDFVLGYCGSLQFELVSSQGEPSLYTEFLEEHGEGIQHLGFFVSDLDRKLAAYKAMGVEPVMSGEAVGKTNAVTRYVYLDHAHVSGLCIEMIETRLFGIPTRMTPLMMHIGHATGDLELVKI